MCTGLLQLQYLRNFFYMCRRSTDCNLVEAVMSDRLWQRMHAPMCAFDAHMRTLVAQSKLSADQEVLECVLAHLVMNDHWLK